MGGTAWMAANIPASASAAVPSMPGLARMGMSLDATKGLGVRLGVGFGSAAEAKAAATEIQGQLLTVKAMLPMAGLPSSVGDTIEVDAKGSVVRMGVFLTLSDLEALRTAVMGASGGASGGTAPPPRPRRPGL